MWQAGRWAGVAVGLSVAGVAHAACGSFGSMDGPNVATLRKAFLRQPLPINAAVGDYAVTVALGTRDAPGAESPAGYTIRLVTNTPYGLGQLSDSGFTTAGTFTDVTAQIHVDDSFPSLGAPVTLEIATISPFDGTVLDVDNVRVTYNGVPVGVFNADFEDLPAPDGTEIPGPPPGWTAEGGGTITIFNPAGDTPYLTDLDDDCCLDDTDGDGDPDCTDGCPNDADNDADGDGFCADEETCPDDPAKTEPGGCGCGVADADGDGDGALDCDDACPADAGDDADGDGVCAAVDDCPDVADPEQSDANADGVGDACAPATSGDGGSVAGGGSGGCETVPGVLAFGASLLAALALRVRAR